MVQHQARLVLMQLQTQEEAEVVGAIPLQLTVTVAQVAQALPLFATPAQFNISLVAQ
jgi:hypothetical protein